MTRPTYCRFTGDLKDVITDCVDSSSSPWFFGKYGFLMTAAKPLPFTAQKGSLGFFDVPQLQSCN